MKYIFVGPNGEVDLTSVIASSFNEQGFSIFVKHGHESLETLHQFEDYGDNFAIKVLRDNEIVASGMFDSISTVTDSGVKFRFRRNGSL